jgi:hypothetical protein
MLHFAPIEPAGQVESIPTVHCCEHTGWLNTSNVSVHTWLTHSVDELLTIVQAAPNAPAPASGAGGASPAQATMNKVQTRKARCMAHDIQGGGGFL